MMWDHTTKTWPLPDFKSGFPDSPTSASDLSTIVEHKDERLSPDINSPQFARNWSLWRKVWATAGAIVSFLVITMATSVYIASIPGIMAEFGVGKTLAISPITFYAIGFTIGPMCTSALSEEFGRQYIYKVSLFLHLVFTLLGGAARDFRTIAVSRAMAGIVGSPSVTVFAGVLNDLWKMPEDKAAVPIFLLYGLGGAMAPEIGPIVGESIVARHDWRWSFWLTAMLVGACFVIMAFMPETFENEIRRKTDGQPRQDLLKVIRAACARPIEMLFVDPIIFPTMAIVTMSQVVVFILYDAFPVVLMRVYQFTPYQTGLAFLSLFVGTLLAAPVLAFFEGRKRKLAQSIPEDSLSTAKFAGIEMVLALVVLAWTVRPAVHWIWPLLAGVLYGNSFALSQLVYPRYKNEVYGAELGASSLAIDVSMRYAISSVFPLFTDQLVEAIGFHWTMTSCALIMLPLAFVPWSLQVYGPRWREEGRLYHIPRKCDSAVFIETGIRPQV